MGNLKRLPSYSIWVCKNWYVKKWKEYIYFIILYACGWERERERSLNSKAHALMHVRLYLLSCAKDQVVHKKLIDYLFIYLLFKVQTSFLGPDTNEGRINSCMWIMCYTIHRPIHGPSMALLFSIFCYY